jgi:hypothetical protein
MTVRFPSITPERRRAILLALFVFLNVAAMAVFLRHRLPEYPIGWDAPYYISRERYFLEQGVVSNRMGYVGLAAAAHALLGVPLVSLQGAATVATTTLLALASGLLVYRGRTAGFRFALVFLLVLWSQGFFALTITTFDNAFALAFALLALAVVGRRADPSRGSAAAFGVCAALVALTHLETFAFLVATLCVFLILSVASRRRVVAVLREYRGYFAGLVPALLLVALQWGSTIATIVSGYFRRADPAGNASIPYAQPESVGDVWRFLTTGVVNPVQGALLILGLGTVAFLAFRRDASRGSLVLAAYGATAYAILLYSVLGGSIPINRSALLVPVPFFVGLGVAVVLRWLFERSRLRLAAVGALGIVAVAVTVPPYARYALRFSPSIQKSAYQGLQELNTYVRAHGFTHFVVVADTPSDERAASAFYGLWTYWTLALFPLPDGDRLHCVYLGTLENYRRSEPTDRPGNPEYRETSEFSLGCVRDLPARPPAFLVDGLSPSDFASAVARSDGARVAPRVIRVD